MDTASSSRVGTPAMVAITSASPPRGTRRATAVVGEGALAKRPLFAGASSPEDAPRTRRASSAGTAPATSFRRGAAFLRGIGRAEPVRSPPNASRANPDLQRSSARVATNINLGAVSSARRRRRIRPAVGNDEDE